MSGASRQVIGNAYLQAQLFRAVRLVADTGMFDLSWSREKAIETFVTMEGHASGGAAREVELYRTSPGHAYNCKLGHTVWVRARERAKRRWAHGLWANPVRTSDETDWAPLY